LARFECCGDQFLWSLQHFVHLHMIEYFRNYIAKYSTMPVTDDEFEKIRACFRPRSLRKKQYFLQEGEVCKYFGFIVKGAMRQYSVDDKGSEHIVALSIENWWVGDRESWVMLTPSIYNIDAWEDTELLIITKADTLKLVQEIPAINEMVRKMDEMHSIAAQKRTNASVSLPADKRYTDFVNSYPDLVQRFPQHIIASYLGITKETLSRVRKRLTPKA
jgi:CRP-like cAMP-binding protein